MLNIRYVKFCTLIGAVLVPISALATSFNIPGSELNVALDAYEKQAGVELIYSDGAVKGIQSKGVRGDLSAEDALSHILAGTGFGVHRESGAIVIGRSGKISDDAAPTHVAVMTLPSASNAALETVTVTSSKIGGDVQNIPISITALSQEQLTATQTAGGPDLVKQVPNMTFTKTNFTGYSIQLRGIGTQAISVTTDPAVAVAFNDVPFIRNHFFEQEFYDVSQVEVLRGPQGTLYGRNATAGVVNLTSAPPTDQFEAMASADAGNYNQRRFEGMINVPVVDDRFDIRIAGEWTKRQGYSFNELTNQRIDGRDLWSGRVTIGLKPIETLQMYLVWEHFSEDDDRMRTDKQLCTTDPIPNEIGGVPVVPDYTPYGDAPYLSQGCKQGSLYSSGAFGVPNGHTLPFYFPLGGLDPVFPFGVDPYASTVQSHNLRVIQTTTNPVYRVKNDIVELNSTYNATPSLTFTSQTSFNHDFLYSNEDYNRFDTTPGVFFPYPGDTRVSDAGVFCDPQLGCSNRLVLQDLSDEHAWQAGQEFRLISAFKGPFNFSAGVNYEHYETLEDYYVFINSLTLFSAGSGTGTGTFHGDTPWIPGVSDNTSCLFSGLVYPVPGGVHEVGRCGYLDPNPISRLNGNGHNYFRSVNPYVLNSYAGFGELYYDILPDVKLTTGLRWTEDQKHFTEIPSELLVDGWGYPSVGVVNQQWDQLSGRVVLNWTPKLDFTDQTLVYGSYSHGYKAGGANPPGAVLLTFNPTDISTPIHPKTFKPEFVDAFELGAKNHFLDGAMTLNMSIFYYNYENYQISEIVDRTSINLNFDAHIKGTELESTWEPIPGLRFNFAGGWEDTAIAKGSKSIDLMDRTAGNPDWVVVKPFVTQASNCILPVFVITQLMTTNIDFDPHGLDGMPQACSHSYVEHNDPLTDKPYTPYPDPTNLPGYPGFDPAAAPNNGEGIDKDLSGNKLPNAPPFTASFGAQYTRPLTSDWAGTLRGDYYWQDYSWARVFNDHPYDRLRGYTTINLSLIFTNQNGWQVMLYDKNIFNETAITGTFLNTDDSGLTTNVFLTDPKLIGVRVTKNW